MKILRAYVVLFAFGISSCLADTVIPEPAVPTTSVGHLEFTGKDGTKQIGAACIINVTGSSHFYIITALHLMRAHGNGTTQPDNNDSPELPLTGTAKIDFLDGKTQTFEVSRSQLSASTRDRTLHPYINELAIYPINDKSPHTQALHLSDKLPAAGEISSFCVWIVAHVDGGAYDGRNMQPGVPFGNSERYCCQLNDDQIISNGTKGAPVINGNGDVVGILFRIGKDNRHQTGLMISAPDILSLIRQTEKQK